MESEDCETVVVLRSLYERLKEFEELDGKVSRFLVYGICKGYGGIEHAVAATVIHYSDEESLKVGQSALPFGFTLIGMVEFEDDEDQDVYTALDNIDKPILLKVAGGAIVASNGLDFLTPLDLDIVEDELFWQTHVCTFRIGGEFLLTSLLEPPDLKDCFALAKSRVLNQAAYTIGSEEIATILPRNGNIISDAPTLKRKVRVSDIVKCVQGDLEKMKSKNENYFIPSITIVDVNMLYDQTKSNFFNKAAILVTDKTASCKLFEHYVNISTLVIVPVTMSAIHLYRKFNAAVCAQLERGFHSNILHQLGNSISAEKPEVFHFWPKFCNHFITIFYPQNTVEEKLLEKRQELHRVLFARQTLPYFRRNAAIFQMPRALISPHTSLKGKYSNTAIIPGFYEYRHYMQDDFNDDGWGCAYRSLQTIISWFRLQGFTSNEVPTHKEIQECLVSLGDKNLNFINSRQWIGSTEVGFVLEALMGISCRIIAISSGADMASRAADLESHFKIHGTPVMIGGGVLAHTIIGVSRNPESETEVQFLILDPHYTGKEDMKTILTKGWVGWKDCNFWKKADFYNMCLPLLPSAI